jgi:uncharacterized membrane protein
MWQELWEQHKGKLAGVIGGLFLSFVYLLSGFWDMLIVAFIIGIGYLIGKRADEHRLGLMVEEFLAWLNERWRPFR